MVKNQFHEIFFYIYLEKVEEIIPSGHFLLKINKFSDY